MRLNRFALLTFAEERSEAACKNRRQRALTVMGGDGSCSTLALAGNSISPAPLQVLQQQEFQEPAEGGRSQEGQCGLNAGGEKARRPPAEPNWRRHRGAGEGGPCPFVFYFSFSRGRGFVLGELFP